jgi:hypothetical protein
MTFAGMGLGEKLPRWLWKLTRLVSHANSQTLLVLSEK